MMKRCWKGHQVLSLLSWKSSDSRMLAWVQIIWGDLFKCRFSGGAGRDSDLVGAYILIRSLVLLRDPFEYQWCWQHWHPEIHGIPCSQSPHLVFKVSLTDRKFSSASGHQ